MRTTVEIEQAMTQYGDAVWRCCCLYFRATADAEDAYQETFLKFALAEDTRFANAEHMKAWLLRVASNVCKDVIKSRKRSELSLDESPEACRYESADPYVEPGSDLALAMDALNRLDDPPKTPLYLALCEGYTAPEISEIVGAPTNTVYSWITRGKKLLREALQ